MTDFVCDPTFWDDFIKEHKVDYFVCGLEECPTTKKFHYQIYLHFANARTMKSVIKKCKGRHVEIARGSPKDNRQYCIKDGKFSEVGIMPQQGERCDLDEIRERIANGVTEAEIAAGSFAKYCQYGRAFEKYRILIEPKRAWQTEVHILWGYAGTGKTRKVTELCDDKHAVCKFSGDKANPFVMGYNGEADVLFDDLDPQTASLQTMLTLCDRYRCVINVKGGERNWAPKRIFITCNDDPMLWFGGAPQWLRRITSVQFFGKNDTEVSPGNTNLGPQLAKLKNFAADNLELEQVPT